jgi:hypothetical protein
MRIPASCDASSGDTLMKRVGKIVSRLLALLILAAAVVANGSIDLTGEPWYARGSFLILFVSGFLGAAYLFRSTYHRSDLESARSSRSMTLFWVLAFVALVITGVVQLSGYLTF